jgi:hypothetical protein
VPRRAYSRRPRHRNDAWKPITGIGLGSNRRAEDSSPASLPTTAMSRSRSRSVGAGGPIGSTPDWLLPGCSMKAAQQAARDAERRFPVPIGIGIPPEGFSNRLGQIIRMARRKLRTDTRS